jgi:hypothetical protein
MLTDPKLRSQVVALWDKFWTGGLTNPLDATEQFSYLLFLTRLDGCENAAERQVEGLSPEGDASQFESLLAQSFDGGRWTKGKPRSTVYRPRPASRAWWG